MDLTVVEVLQLIVYFTENAVRKPFTFFDKARVESSLLSVKYMEDVPPPLSPTQLNGNEASPHSSPLVKAVEDNDDAIDDEDASDEDANDEDATPPPLPRAKSVEEDNVLVSPAHSPSKLVEDDDDASAYDATPPPSPHTEYVEEDIEEEEDASADDATPPPSPRTKYVEEDNAPVSPARSPSPEPQAETIQQHVPLMPRNKPTEPSALAPLVSVAPAPVPDQASVLSALAGLFTGSNAAPQDLLSALTALMANTGSGTVPSHAEPATTSGAPATSEVQAPLAENTSVASSNIEQVGKKRKRGRPAKIHSNATPSSASTLDDPASKPASTGRRTGRKLKPVTKGPVLVSDPTGPPRKKVK